MTNKSGRGGYRPGAGRKGEWKSGKTKAVKLPESLIPRIVELARMLDEGGEINIKNDSVTESIAESVTESNNSLKAAADKFLVTLPPKDRRAAKRLLYKFIENLS